MDFLQSIRLGGCNKNVITDFFYLLYFFLPSVTVTLNFGQEVYAADTYFKGHRIESC